MKAPLIPRIVYRLLSFRPKLCAYRNLIERPVIKTIIENFLKSLCQTIRLLLEVYRRYTKRSDFAFFATTPAVFD